MAGSFAFAQATVTGVAVTRIVDTDLRAPNRKRLGAFMLQQPGQPILTPGGSMSSVAGSAYDRRGLRSEQDRVPLGKG